MGKKRKKTTTVTERPVEANAEVKGETSESDIKNAESKTGAKSEKPESNIKNAETASLTAKVLAEQEERNKRRKLGANENVKSLYTKKTGNGETLVDFMTRGFSIPANARR